MSIVLKEGDYNDLIKDIPDKSIDLILTDPPYEFKCGGFGGGKNPLSNRAFKKELQHNKLFHQDFDETAFMTTVERVMKKVNICVFGTEPMILKLWNYAEKKGYISTLTFWRKTNPPPYFNNNYLKDVELCILIREKGVALHGKYDTMSKVYTSSVNKKDKSLYHHPTIKPLELIEKYIFNHSVEGDTVLDMYMGSGTTGVACKKMNRNFIGFELDHTYFETAKQRIEEYNSLFL